MRTEKELKELYDGKAEKDLVHLTEKSFYNHNYYEGFDGDILYAESDDDNYTAWYFVESDWSKEFIGYSTCEEGDIIHIHLDASVWLT